MNHVFINPNKQPYSLSPNERLTDSLERTLIQYHTSNYGSPTSVSGVNINLLSLYQWKKKIGLQLVRGLGTTLTKLAELVTFLMTEVHTVKRHMRNAQKLNIGS